MRLAAAYAGLLLVIVALFSITIYAYMDYAFGNDYVDRVTNEIQHEAPNGQRRSDVSNAVDAGLERLRNALLLADAALLVTIPVVSYSMAKRALRPIEESYAAQQQFVDDASHELRTPLSVISGELELALRRKRSSEQYRETIEAGLAETHSLITLVNNLLVLARGEQSSLARSFVPFELRASVEHVLARLSPEARARVKYEFRRDGVVVGSPELIERAVGNLVDNALKYSPTDAPVNVAVDCEADMLRIVVSDTGAGMSPDEVRQAFERFWRAESSRHSPGHGLGLVLVRRIAQLHGGSIRLDSRPGQGTRAILQLPLASR